MALTDFKTQALSNLQKPTTQIVSQGFLPQDQIQQADNPQMLADQEEESPGILSSIWHSFRDPIHNLGEDIGQGIMELHPDVKRMRESLDALKKINPEEADRLALTYGENLTAKKIIGDVAGTALSIASVIPGVGLANLGKAGMLANLASKGSLAEKILVTSKASPYIRASLEGGFWAAGFEGANALSENKSAEDVAKTTGYGALFGLAVGPVFHGVVALGGAGMKGISNLDLTKNIWTRIADTTPAKFVDRFISRVGTVLSADANGRQIVEGIKNADRNTLLGLARVMDIFGDTVAFKANVKTMEGAEAAYNFGRQALNKKIANGVAIERGKISGIVKLGEDGPKVGVGAQEGIIGDLPEDIARLNDIEKFQAYYDDFDEARRILQLQEKNIDRTTGKITFNLPKPKENSTTYTPHIAADIERLQDDLPYRRFTIQQMVDDSKSGFSKFTFETFEQAEQFVDSWIEFASKNGRGTMKTEALVKGMIQSGQADSPSQALKLLDTYRKNTGKVKLGSYLELARDVDFPIYNPFPGESLISYAMDSLKRVEMVNQFGYKLTKANKVSYPIIDKAIENLRKVHGSESDQYKTFNQFLDIALERVNQKSNSVIEAGSLFVRTLAVPKLAYAQIMNLNQGILAPLLKTDLDVTVRGIMQSFKYMGRKEAAQSGVVLNSVINDIIQSKSGQYGTKFLKATGFIATETWNRTVSANIFKLWTEKQFKNALDNPNIPIYKSYLTELGINADQALKRGKLTNNEILKAMQIGVEKTQFMSKPVDLPYWSSSPAGKIFWQFRNFSYQQTNFLKDELIFNMKQGQYKRAARQILILATVYPMAGEVLLDIRSLFTGSKRPTKFLDRYFNGAIAAGSMAIFGDVIQSSEYGKMEIAAPGLSTIAGTLLPVFNLGRAALTSYEYDIPENIKAVLKEYGLFAPLLNRLTPPKKGQESFGKTLQTGGENIGF